MGEGILIAFVILATIGGLAGFFFQLIPLVVMSLLVVVIFAALMRSDSLYILVPFLFGCWSMAAVRYFLLTDIPWATLGAGIFH